MSSGDRCGEEMHNEADCVNCGESIGLRRDARVVSDKAIPAHDPEWWKKDVWRIHMKARVTSPDVLKEWRDARGSVIGIMEHEVQLAIDGSTATPWFFKTDVAPTVEDRTNEAKVFHTMQGTTIDLRPSDAMPQHEDDDGWNTATRQNFHRAYMAPEQVSADAPAREELRWIKSYLAHNDQDANHAWMVRRIDAIVAGKDPGTVIGWTEHDGVRRRTPDPDAKWLPLFDAATEIDREVRGSSMQEWPIFVALRSALAELLTPRRERAKDRDWEAEARFAGEMLKVAHERKDRFQRALETIRRVAQPGEALHAVADEALSFGESPSSGDPKKEGA